MARDSAKKHRQTSIGTPSPVSLGFDPTGKTKPIDVLSSKDSWSEYTLEDGTVLRVKAAVLDVKQAVGQYSAEGDPVYLIQTTFVIRANVPDELKRKK